MMDNKKSGGRRKILRCRTALSKKKIDAEADADVGISCPHMLLWTRDRTGDWKLNWGQSILEHKPFCDSGQIVNKFQLVNDPEFVKVMNLGKLSTGKQAAKVALGVWTADWTAVLKSTRPVVLATLSSIMATWITTTTGAS